MKGSSAGLLLWVCNAAILAGGGFVGYKLWKDMGAKSADIDASVRKGVAFAPEEWNQIGAVRASLQFPSMKVQPGKAWEPPPKPIVGPGPGGDTGPVAPPPFDLAAEKKKLGEAIAAHYTLTRIFVVGDGGPSLVIIELKDLANAPLVLGVGENLTSFKNLAKDTEKAKIDKAVVDAIIVGIKPGAVVLQATNPEIAKNISRIPETDRTADGRVEIELTITLPKEETEDALSKLRTGDPTVPAASTSSGTDPFTVPAGAKPVEPQEDQVFGDRNETNRYSTFTEDRGEIGWEDWNDDTFNTLSNYAMTYIDAEGRPAGIQVSSALPDDSNLARRAGAKPGDVIKSINGQSVSNMQEVRAVVTKQRNAGTEDFVVVFERNGVEQTKTFHVKKAVKK